MISNENVKPHCLDGPPCVAVLIGRWGSWPTTMALLLRTLGTNSRTDFHLLSEEPPAPLARLPPNVHFHRWTHDTLYDRLSQTVGLKLPNGSRALQSNLRSAPGSGFLAGRDISGAKVRWVRCWGKSLHGEVNPIYIDI